MSKNIDLSAIAPKLKLALAAIAKAAAGISKAQASKDSVSGWRQDSRRVNHRPIPSANIAMLAAKVAESPTS